MLRGSVHRFGDDVNTDNIIAAQHKTSSLDLADMATHTFEDIDPDFASRVQPGDVVVAGKNFGCGSSRESAVHVLSELGVAAVLAPSFARIYFRNAINCGLPVFECDTTAIEAGDTVEVDADHDTATDVTRNIEVPVHPMSQVLRGIVDAGGLIAYVKLHGDLVFTAD